MLRKQLLAITLWLAATTQVMAAHPHVAQRVITLSPHATELAFSAGLGDKIVGVSQASDYPPEAGNIEQIASYQNIKLERVLTLQPDLVIAWHSNANAKELDKIKQFGIPIYYSDIETLTDIPKNIRQLSQWAADPTIGQHNAAVFEATLEHLHRKYQHRSKVRYFYQLSDQPLMSFSPPHWPNDILSVCGGQNILPQQAVAYPQVNQEQVIALKPDVIFIPEDSLSHSIWQKWPQIPAVKHQFIWSLNPDWISRPTMRSLKALEQVCHYLDKVRSL